MSVSEQNAAGTGKASRDAPDGETKEGPDTSFGGEDESSTEHEGDDSHLHEDQKSPRLKT